MSRGSGLSAEGVELVVRSLGPEESEGGIAEAFSDWRGRHGLGDFESLVSTLELHGILPFLAEKWEALGLLFEESEGVTLRNRLETLRNHSRRWILTLDRFLTETETLGLDVILLKGSALALDLYPSEFSRAQGDVDVLVRREDVSIAIEAARKAGLRLIEDQFPVFWYRRVHFHLKLHPGLPLLSELEIHWSLHSPALLKTVSGEAVRGRARSAEFRGHRVRLLDPLDTYLHLASHLKSHWGKVPDLDGTSLVRGLLATTSPEVRVKWVLDLVLSWESLTAAPGFRLEALVERAEEWNGEEDLALALRLLPGRGISSRSSGFADEAKSVLGVTAFLRRDVGSRSLEEAVPVESSAPLPRPTRGYDFRWEALGLLPRWWFPPRQYLLRKYRRVFPGRIGLGTVLVLRGVHGIWVGLQVLFALLLWGPALVGRWWLRSRRRREKDLKMSPAEILDLVASMRGPGSRVVREQGGAERGQFGE